MKSGRQIVFYGNYFQDFFISQTEKVRERIEYVFQLIRTVEKVPEKFLKHLEGTYGLYEIRVSVGNNIFRIFAALIRETWLYYSTLFTSKRKRRRHKS